MGYYKIVYINEPSRLCKLLDGRIVAYDAAVSCSNEKTPEWMKNYQNPKWKFIGIGIIYMIEGVETDCKELCYFYKWVG